MTEEVTASANLFSVSSPIALCKYYNPKEVYGIDFATTIYLGRPEKKLKNRNNNTN